MQTYATILHCASATTKTSHIYIIITMGTPELRGATTAGEDDDDNDDCGTHQTCSCRSNKQKSVSQLVS